MDFPVHTVDRLIRLVRGSGRSIGASLGRLYPETGRALFFNFAAVVLGFGILALGSVPSIREFGVLVAVCITATFLGSLTLLPAFLLAWQPRFLTGLRSHASRGR